MVRNESQYLNVLSLLALIWTRQTVARRFRGDTHAQQLAAQYRFLREEV